MIDDTSASGKGGNSSSEAFPLPAKGIGNDCNLLMCFLAAMIGFVCAMLVPGELAVFVVATILAPVRVLTLSLA